MMSDIGPKQILLVAPQASAFEGKADIGWCALHISASGYDVRCWPSVDIVSCTAHVCFRGE